MTRVRHADPSDLAEVTASISDAFMDDPLMSWALPDADSRLDRLAGLFGYLAEHRYLALGQSVVADGGAALWLPEGADDDDFWEAHGPAFTAAMGGESERLGAMSEAMDAHHPHDPHRYLMAIGVHRSNQGRGLGGEMLDFALADVDAAGEAAYLEATSPQSRALYQRHGFIDLGEFTVADGPPLWPMWREPRPS